MCEVYRDSLRFWERYFLSFHRLRKSLRNNDCEFGVILAGIFLPCVIHAIIIIRLANGYESLSSMLHTLVMITGLVWWALSFLLMAIFFVCDFIERDFSMKSTMYKMLHILMHVTASALYILFLTLVPYLPFAVL